MFSFLTFLAVVAIVCELLSRLELPNFRMYSIGFGAGGDFFSWPRLKFTKIKNIEMIVFGWLYFFVTFQALAKRPKNKLN